MAAQDYFILSEMEELEAQGKEPEMGWQTSMRLSSLASNQFSRAGSERRATMDSQASESLLSSSDFPQVRLTLTLICGAQAFRVLVGLCLSLHGQQPDTA